jgi:hypothetical protein
MLFVEYTLVKSNCIDHILMSIKFIIKLKFILYIYIYNSCNILEKFKIIRYIIKTY